MSMLRTLARRDQIGDVVHVHSAPTESDVMFARELAELADAHDGLPVVGARHAHRGPPRPGQAGRRGAGLA